MTKEEADKISDEQIDALSEEKAKELAKFYNRMAQKYFSMWLKADEENSKLTMQLNYDNIKK